MKRAICMVCAAALMTVAFGVGLTGCATSTTRETATDPETGWTDTFSVKHRVFAPPGAKAVGEQRTVYDGEGEHGFHFETGQAGEIETDVVLGELLIEVIRALATANRVSP